MISCCHTEDKLLKLAVSGTYIKFRRVFKNGKICTVFHLFQDLHFFSSALWSSMVTNPTSIYKVAGSIPGLSGKDPELP